MGSDIAYVGRLLGRPFPIEIASLILTLSEASPDTVQADSEEDEYEYEYRLR